MQKEYYELLQMSMSKRLLHFAHRGEAQCFLQKGHFRPIPGELNLYSSDEDFLLIAGEGRQQTLVTTSYALGQLGNEVSEIINLGIAGSLEEKNSLGNIVKVRTFYSHEFKSFSTAEIGLDCYTCDHRVLNSQQAKEFKNFASLIDREGWAVGMVAKQFRKKFSSYKLISDFAGDQTDCFDLKSRAQEFSEKLWQYFQSLDHQEGTRPNELPEGFYFTAIQKKEYLSLLKKISQLPLLDEIKEAEKHPKTRSKILIERMRKTAYPMREELEDKKKKLFSQLLSSGWNIQSDMQFESKDLKLEGRIKSLDDYKKLQMSFKSLPWTKWEDFMDGNI